MTIAPDNGQAKTMLAFDQQHQPEQIERERVERLNRPRQAFNAALKQYTDAGQFDEHELTTGMKFDAVGPAIRAALLGTQRAFKVVILRTGLPEIYALEATQEVSGGQRRCLIVCGQTKDDETQILYKVFEFESKHDISLSGGLSFNTTYIPLVPAKVGPLTDKMKAQIAAGVLVVTDCIRQAIDK
jgi:hypothetical protein